MKEYDIRVHRGETMKRVLRFSQNDEVVDLTGWLAKSQVREDVDGGALAAEMETSIEGPEGKVTLIVPAEVTAGMESGGYVWDLRMTSEEDEVLYCIGGKFIVLPSVTE